MVALVSSTLPFIDSAWEMGVGNLPALLRPGPSILGICLIKESDARKASYFLASFLTNFLFLFNFLRASASIQGIWLARASSMCCWSPKMQTLNLGRGMYFSLEREANPSSLGKREKERKRKRRRKKTRDLNTWQGEKKMTSFQVLSLWTVNMTGGVGWELTVSSSYNGRGYHHLTSSKKNSDPELSRQDKSKTTNLINNSHKTRPKCNQHFGNGRWKYKPRIIPH